MKDSSGDWNNTKTFLDAFSKSGFDIFVASESFLLANMQNGGVGTISATANVNPGAIHDLYQKWSDICAKCRGNSQMLAAASPSTPAELKSLQMDLDLVRQVLSSRKFPSMIAALKRAIAIYRNDPEWERVRPPLVELTLEQAQTLATELSAIHFTMPA
jgi:4-hydroxy-tetrahydrodipicolinate synthase